MGLRFRGEQVKKAIAAVKEIDRNALSALYLFHIRSFMLELPQTIDFDNVLSAARPVTGWELSGGAYCERE
jgi:hypothetical protein